MAAVARFMAVEASPDTTSVDRLDRCRRAPSSAAVETWRIAAGLRDDQIGPPLVSRKIVRAPPLVIVLPLTAVGVERPATGAYPCAVLPPRRELASLRTT